MYLRSTGLGKTLLQCKAAKIEHTDVVPETLKHPQDGEMEPKRLLLTMKVTEPVTWTVRAFIEPKDLRDIIGLFFKNPSILWHAARFLFSGNGAPSVIVKREREEAST
jgi:hypothetical protein